MNESLADKLNKAKAEMEEKLKPEKKEIAKPNQGVKHLYPLKEPKLFVSGKLNRKEHKYVTPSLAITKKRHDEIKEYCRGNELSILNYLIFLGLEHVKKNSNVVTVDISDIESS